MIKLKLLNACQNCPDFEAKSTHIGMVTRGFNIEPCCQVTCVHINKCSALLKHLEKEVKKDGN